MDELKRDEAATAWLLESSEPAVRLLVRRDLLDQADPVETESILDGPWVTALLAGQRDDGGFGGHPYQKWTGAHWRLVSLVELEVPAGEPRAVAAAETVLAWLTGARHRDAIRGVAGLTRRCASQEGNALAVCCRLGLATDARVRLLAESLIGWQWPDGGWNCDARPGVQRSSVHETLPPMWGLSEYAAATGDKAAARAAGRAAELLLARRVFQAMSGREPLSRTVTALHYPPYWHYDVLQAMLVLTRMGHGGDPRTSDAVALLRARQLADGRWRAGGRWWSPPGASRGPEVINWGQRGPNVMVTLNALRVLRSTEQRRAGTGSSSR